MVENERCVYYCGNGIQDPNEDCDDSNFIDGDGCSNCIVDQSYLCTGYGAGTCIFGYCNTPSEQCNDGNFANNDGCSSICSLEEGYTCGGTPYTCTAVCGNGRIKTSIEDCDDGNSVPDDGCSNCLIDTGYVCSGEPSFCTSVCGDGIKVETLDFEACDDQNTNSND